MRFAAAHGRIEAIMCTRRAFTNYSSMCDCQCDRELAARSEKSLRVLQYWMAHTLPICKTMTVSMKPKRNRTEKNCDFAKRGKSNRYSSTCFVDLALKHYVPNNYWHNLSSKPTPPAWIEMRVVTASQVCMSEDSGSNAGCMCARVVPQNLAGRI